MPLARGQHLGLVAHSESWIPQISLYGWSELALGPRRALQADPRAHGRSCTTLPQIGPRNTTDRFGVRVAARRVCPRARRVRVAHRESGRRAGPTTDRVRKRKSGLPHWATSPAASTRRRSTSRPGVIPKTRSSSTTSSSRLAPCRSRDTLMRPSRPSSRLLPGSGDRRGLHGSRQFVQEEEASTGRHHRVSRGARAGRASIKTHSSAWPSRNKTKAASTKRAPGFERARDSTRETKGALATRRPLDAQG